jgi:hypothetical protein
MEHGFQFGDGDLFVGRPGRERGKQEHGDATFDFHGQIPSYD